MTLRGCSREKEVNELVTRGQWPQAASADVREHVQGCRVCADLVLVASAFQSARAETLAAAQAGQVKLGSAGALWWRAQLRRRRAAVERIERPLVSAQIFALAVSLLAALGLVGFEARHGVAWLDWLEGLPQAATVQMADFSSSGWTWMLLAAGATLALVAGLVVYLAGDKQ
jgi:hypothetical protein